MAVDSGVRHLGPSGADDQEGNREFALLHEHLAGRRGQRPQLRGERHESLGGTAGEDFQRGQFVGADIGQAGHLTRLRLRRRDEQGNAVAAGKAQGIESLACASVLAPDLRDPPKIPRRYECIRSFPR